MTHLILGSTSPRRREILGYFSLPFDPQSPVFDEDSVSFNGDPSSFALKIAVGKALSLSQQYPEAAILTADTVVFKDGQVFGKAKSDKEAFEMLKALSGGWHSVFTAVVLAYGEKQYSQVEETKVLMNPLSDNQIKQYLEALHWADKAGSYAIQLAGSLIVARIDGCYYNVMGLPINTVRSLLEKIGIHLWDYLN